MLRHNHRHLVLTAFGLTAPPDDVTISRWLYRLPAKVRMHILHEPVVKVCTDAGNEGTTGYVLIKTSHASIHVWDKVARPYAKIDLYSCADFAVLDVLELVAEFGPTACEASGEPAVEYLLLDRNGPRTEMLEGGSLSSMDFFRPARPSISPALLQAFRL